MADKDTREDELGRSKHSATPREHLAHLLNIGWNPRSPLIQKYAIENGLTRDLEELARELRTT
jgi:hypothetical protein